MRDFKLSLRCQWDLRHFGILLSLKLRFLAEVVGQPIDIKKKCKVLQCWVTLATILMIPSISWDVVPHHWVMVTRRFETAWCSHFQGWTYLNGHSDAWIWRQQSSSDAIPHTWSKETWNLLWKTMTSSVTFYKGLSSMELTNAHWNMRNTSVTMADGSRQVFLAVSYRQLQMYHSHV
jgi:hypothetical protein